MRENYYPRVTVDLEKFKSNVHEVVNRCEGAGIEVAGVIKGFTGIPQCAEGFIDGGAGIIASSRLEQLRRVGDLRDKVPFMMIRIPMVSEVADVVEIADISLNSEIGTLRLLNEAAAQAGIVHKVILMVDLGDLREGYWEKDQLLEAALEVENQMANLELAGLGTNLGCYGSVEATPEKLGELVADARMIESAIGRKLEYISGGATTSFPRVLEGNMPEGINQLRIGEGIILGKDLEDLWGYDMSYMNKDVFTLEAEIIELKVKPSHPVGNIMFDAFGGTPEYEDIGNRRKALIALGKVDYGFPGMIYPRDEGVRVLGASSDHTILDIEESTRDFSVGDVVKFDLCYATIVYATHSENVKIVCI